MNKPIILLIDDEPMYNEIISDYFSSKYLIEYAQNLKEGLRKIVEVRPSLIILDWNIGNDNGLSFLNKIKTEIEFSSIPVIMFTANKKEENEIDGLSSGADDYVTKPFKIKILEARIETNLRKYFLNNKKNQFYGSGIALNENSLCVLFNNKTIKLTKKEFKIISILLKNPEETFSQEDLNYMINEEKTCVTKKTIDTLVYSIRNKLKNRTIILSVKKKGYKININKFINQYRKVLKNEKN